MSSRFLATVASLTLGATIVAAQTKVTPPKNKYTVEEDIKLGREAAAEARKQLPILQDTRVSGYVEQLGRRLAAAIPAEYQQPKFNYTFETVNVRDINAFALPGGPMFVNRGMIEAAKNEGEVAGVMAHEISHVILRHGTAQAGKQTYEQGINILGAVIGAVVGGTVGNVISQGTPFLSGTYFTRYSREAEKQADLVGARIMSLSGYDPRDMASMFKTIEREGGGGGPEFLSDHPNPGNRADYITKEAAFLPVPANAPPPVGFAPVRQHLNTLPKAPTTEEYMKRRTAQGEGSAAPDAPPSGRPGPPSSRSRTYKEGSAFQITVPDNWQRFTATNSVTYAPNGAYGTYQGATVFTHGVEAGIAKIVVRDGDLRTATNELIASLSRSNPRLSGPSNYQEISVDGRDALQTSLGNVSDATGSDEVIQLITTRMNDGNLFYAVAVAPRDQFDSYGATFRRVLSSIRLLNQ